MVNMADKLTPLKAIRRHCLHCMGGSYQLVRDCPSMACPLYPLRLKRAVKGVGPLRQIRAMCKQCVGTAAEVKKCDPNFLDGETCSLYRYRFGKRPKEAGSFATNLNKKSEVDISVS